MDPASSPQAASVHEALLTGQHPERLTALIPPAPFDVDAWASDAAYRERLIATIEPGRVFQTATPGPTTPALIAVSPDFVELPSVGATAELVVQAPPGALVTFNSLDSGAFEGTGLATTSAIADDAGLARAVFGATAGTVDRVRILVGSPQAGGQIVFQIHIPVPEP